MGFQRLFLVVTNGLSFLPLIFLGSLVALAVRTRIYLGRWPTYGSPDPKNLPFDFQYTITELALVSFAFGGIIYLALLPFGFRLMKRNLPFFLIGSVLVLLLSTWVRPNLMEWFLD